jgi:hypothetical protein
MTACEAPSIVTVFFDPARSRRRVHPFAALQVGGPHLEFGYILCHAGSLLLCKMDARRHGADR